MSDLGGHIALASPTPANLTAFADDLLRLAESKGWPKVRTADDVVYDRIGWRFVVGWHSALGRVNRLAGLARALEG